MPPLLELDHLSVSFDTPEGTLQAVRGVSLTLNHGETLAIVGESGCGKSVLCRSLMKLLPDSARIEGRALVDGQDVIPLKEKAMRGLRGVSFAMLFQDPMATLNPTIPVGKQIMEAIVRHEKVSRDEAARRAVALLDMVGIDDPVHRMRQQPHFFSGGMRQRCVLAIALALSPKLLLADEPTTALDVTVQARMLDLLKDIQRKAGIGIALVTHDLGVVARVADRVAVMYAGKIVEIGTAEEIFYDPRHPYTWGLLGALPSLAVERGALRGIPGMPPSLLNPPEGDAFAQRNEYALAIDYQHMPPMFPVTATHSAATWLLDGRAPRISPPPHVNMLCASPCANLCGKDANDAASRKENSASPLLSIRDYHQYFRLDATTLIRAVNGISLDVRSGEIFGLVGESGCGKSTVARAVMGMLAPTKGDISFKQCLVSDKKSYAAHKKDIQRSMQIIFQDSAAALNPRMTVRDLVAEPLNINYPRLAKKELNDRIFALLNSVGLEAALAGKLPGEISGGQRQRVAVARAISVRPEFIVADEPIASLDVSIQAQIVSLFQQLRREQGFSLLFIAHDLSMVRYLCDRVGVMYGGRLVELAPAGALFGNPLHPYTQALLASIPRPDPLRERAKSIPPRPAAPLSTRGDLREAEPGHFVLARDKDE